MLVSEPHLLDERGDGDERVGVEADVVAADLPRRLHAQRLRLLHQERLGGGLLGRHGERRLAAAVAQLLLVFLVERGVELGDALAELRTQKLKANKI